MLPSLRQMMTNTRKLQQMSSKMPLKTLLTRITKENQHRDIKTGTAKGKEAW